MMDSLTVHIGGKNRAISPEVFFKHLAAALRGRDLLAGEHDVVIERDGCVWLDGTKVYEPKRPQIAARAKAS
jgi:hypothetical protein